MKALLYTSDPYEPSGVIGLYETEEQKQTILEEYGEVLDRAHKERLKTVKFPGYYAGYTYQTREEAYEKTVREYVDDDIQALKEIEIPIGVYGEYF